MADKISPKNGPYVLEAKPGRYSWCSCGHSENQPFCDNTHREKSSLKSVKVEIGETKMVAWCGCKETKTPPYCDGSHKFIKPGEE